MRVSDEALYLTDPLGSVSPEQIRAEILAAEAPPQMTKDGPKPPTKKMIAAAAARKESTLRAVLDARRTRDAPVDWLVAPVCLGVLRRESSSPEHVRLAVEIVREAEAIAPEDEPILAETLRLGLAGRGVAAAAGAAHSTPGAVIGGGSSSRTGAHLRVLAVCPPRVGAIVLWRERERVAKLVAGEGASAGAADAAARAAAVVAVGALLSRSDAVEAVVRYAPAHADATGASGDGARFLIDLWRRVALLAEDAAAPDAAAAAAANALALLLGPALADAHPAAARVLAAHARDPALHGEYTAAPYALGGERDASLADLVRGSKASANGARWVGDGWARSAARAEGVAARGPATSVGGDDPTGAGSPTLAAIRLDLTMRVVARARHLVARGARLAPAERPIAAGAPIAALCAALERGDGASPASTSGTPARPKTADGGGGGTLSRLRDAARARAFDDPGGFVALVADTDAARKDLRRLASAGAEYAGEALLRTMASAASGAGPRADPRACLAAGAGLLALSGSLGADAQPLDWVPVGTSALLAAVARDVVPEVNGDEEHSVNPFDGAPRAPDDAPREGGDGGKPGDRPLPPARKTKKTAMREAARVPALAGDAVAPLSRAAFMLVVADALPSMPISQPLRAIHALVHESKRGLRSRRDVRVAVLARALAAHAALRTHPETVAVTTPLGEIVGSLLEDDCAAPRAEAAEADAAAAPQFREDLCVCAVEAVLRAQPEPRDAAFEHETEFVADMRAGWCQVALEAAATVGRAALWPAAATGGRRAASDAATRLIARLCAATRALVTERSRVEPPGVHLAAQRVLAALVQETARAQKEGAVDDAAAACVAWLACAHLDFPDPKTLEANAPSAARGGVGVGGAFPGDVDAEALAASRAAASRAAQYARQGGPHGPAVCAMVEGLVRGGAARFAARVRAAAAQREAGSMFGAARAAPDDAARSWDERHASPEAVAAAGVACVDILGERCPPLAERLAGMLELCVRGSGTPEDAGPATRARARALAARLRGVAARRGEGVASSARAPRDATVAPVPPPATDPRTHAALEPPPILLAHLASRDGAVSGRRWVAGDAPGARRDASAAAAAAAADFAALASARDAVEAATRLLKVGADRTSTASDASASPGLASVSGDRARAVSRSGPVPLTGPSDPCWIEASHETRVDARVARVALRCRPPPSSSDSGAAGSAGLEGTLQVGTHAPLAFVDGAVGVTVELSGAAAREKAAAAARDVGGVGGDGGVGDAFASTGGNAGHVGHVVSRCGVGADEETIVTVEVRIRAFERVALRPLVTFGGARGVSSDVSFGGGGVPADGAPAATLRCAPYEIPLADLLLPDDAFRGDPGRWERLWTILPASFELAARVDLAVAATQGHAARAALAAAAAALGGTDDASVSEIRGADSRDAGGRARNASRRTFARCGAYALRSAGASCERFAATTWDGEHILVAVFASGEGVRLEHRARAAATLAPAKENPTRWLAEIAGGVLAVAETEADEYGDASLFRPPVDVARMTAPGDGVELLDAVAREWKAMADA